MLFDSLCPLLRYELPKDNDIDIQQVQKFDKICEEIANTITAIASYGIQDIKDQEGNLTLLIQFSFFGGQNDVW